MTCRFLECMFFMRLVIVGYVFIALKKRVTPGVYQPRVVLCVIPFVHERVYVTCVYVVVWVYAVVCAYVLDLFRTFPVDHPALAPLILPVESRRIARRRPQSRQRVLFEPAHNPLTLHKT